MKKIQETKRYKYWEEELAEQEYKRSFVDNGKRTTPKERRADYLSRKFGWDRKELRKLKSKQLGKIVYDNGIKNTIRNIA